MEQLSKELSKLHQRLEARVRKLEKRKQQLAGLGATPKVGGRGRKPEEIHNPFTGLKALLREDQETIRTYGYPGWLDDVLRGVASLDWYRPNARSIPLSVRHMLVILDQLPVITATQVASLLLVEIRQAQRYVQALRVAMPYLIAGMPAGTLERIAALQEESICFDDNCDEDEIGFAA
ncbi:hypothetical protein [Stutzerimonas stutzeri]|uniref:hypothetical protein n=1 Tax=Stutzerimonas stutzeri TaxID=316 RepID=UPI000698D427|nr:hypothetical protein [Stutzerimonas stutzeri]